MYARATGDGAGGRTDVRTLAGSLPLDDDGRVLDRWVEDDVRLANSDTNALRGGKALEDAVRNGPGQALEEEALRPGEDLADELGQVAIVDGLLDVVARRRRVVDVHPQVDEEALAEPALGLEVTVVAEDHQAQ